MQEGVNFKPDIGAVITKETNSINDLNFEGVDIKLRRKKLISMKWKNKKTKKLKHYHHITAVANKCALLNSLQEESEAFQKHSRTSKVALFSNE